MSQEETGSGNKLGRQKKRRRIDRKGKGNTPESEGEWERCPNSADPAPERIFSNETELEF